MAGHLLISLALLASLALYAQASDVKCVKGSMSTSITLNEGESFKFDTNGRKYAANQNCVGSYTMGTCTEATITCKKFNLKNTNSKCTKGDTLVIKDATTTKNFCKRNKPNGYAVSGDFSLTFESDARKNAVGFKCVVDCSSGGGGGGTTASPPPLPVGSCKCGLANRSTRIVGGTVTEINEYPWQVGVVSMNGNFVWCGASVIGDRYIMTAAHCTAGESASKLQVLLGDHDYTSETETKGLRLNVAEIKDNPAYDARATNTDFSILKLSTPIDFAAYPNIRPICLPADDKSTYAGNTATVTGWGTTASGGSTTNKLREVDVKVLTNTQCTSLGGYNPGDITSQMLCASVPEGGKDSCQGDSGGPLVTSGTGDGVTAGQNYELIGVVSWGIGCADAKYPGVYSRVNQQLNWISEVAAGNLNSCPRV